MVRGIDDIDEAARARRFPCGRIGVAHHGREAPKERCHVLADDHVHGTEGTVGVAGRYAGRGEPPDGLRVRRCRGHVVEPLHI